MACDEEFRGWGLGVCFCEFVVEFLVSFYGVEDALAWVEAGDLDDVFVCCFFMVSMAVVDGIRGRGKGRVPSG